MATSESSRPRRFALPDLADKRGGEAIEAFLEGPGVRRRSRSAPTAAVASRRRKAAPGTAVAKATTVTHRPSTELRTLPGRLEWNAALERENARAARYGRPAAVAIVELKAARPGQLVDPYLGALAGPIARTLRDDSRATDVVARVAGNRFQMLLP